MSRKATTPRAFRKLFGEFDAPSWQPWNAIEDAMFGRKPADAELVRRVTGRTVLPNAPVSEAWFVAGRGSGKSRFGSRLASYFATARTYQRAPGEQVYVGVFAPDRKQAGVTFRYIAGLLQSVPSLAALVVAERKDAIELSNGVTVEVITASMAAPRGRSYALAIIEEAAFLPSDESAEPDRELLRAIRPALARVPGSLLVVVSSPYAQRGVLHDTWKAKFGTDDPHVLVVQADTATLNPTFSMREIQRAYADDATAAEAEYGALFRRDIVSLLTPDAVDAVTVPGRLELPPVEGRAYVAFVDPAGGSGADAMTVAIVHAERHGEQLAVVLDCVREARPPFSPEQTVAEFSETLRAYRVDRVTGDRYAGEWPREQFRKQGIEYVPAEKAKSDLYRDLLPLINSRQVELLDHVKLRSQLLNLERRTARGGRDSIDHAPGSHDDVANSVAGAVVVAHRRGSQHELAFSTGSRKSSVDEQQRLADEEMERKKAASASAVERMARHGGFMPNASSFDGFGGRIRGSQWKP